MRSDGLAERDEGEEGHGGPEVMNQRANKGSSILERDISLSHNLKHFLVFRDTSNDFHQVQKIDD